MKKQNIRENGILLKRCLKIIKSADKGHTVRQIALRIPSVLQEYLHILIITGIIDMVISNEPQKDIILFTIITGLIELALFCIRHIINRGRNCREFAFEQNKQRMLWEKLLHMDYVYLENPETHIKYQQARNGMARLDNVLFILADAAEGLITAGMGFALIAPIALRNTDRMPGFWGFINSNGGLFLVIFIATFLEMVRALAPNKKALRYMSLINNDKDTMQYVRTAHYYTGDVGRNYRNGKDIRVYGEQELILGEYQKNTDNWIGEWEKGIRKVCLAYSGIYGITLISNLLIYGFAVVRAIAGTLTVGQIIGFVMYFSKIRDGITRVTEGIGEISVNHEYIRYVFDFLDIPDEKYKGTIPTEKRDDNEYEFAFHHVSFRYPGSEQYALQDVNLKWKIGEKMALVGKNGCGKSTLIKLLCRLYDPTEGEITLNGIDIRKYQYEDYMALFSVVFQDSGLFCFSMAENVAANVEYDAKRVMDCVVRTGLGGWLDKLDQGIETCLYKNFDEHGVEISGGEAQKLCLARAIYKGAPFIVLDEPTAALDPISEHDIYTKFNGIVGTRTAVYISHRLSSCRFCDEIVVMENGTVVERGSHNSLLEQDGVYKALWTAQAEYYKDTAGELYAV